MSSFSRLGRPRGSRPALSITLPLAAVLVTCLPAFAQAGDKRALVIAISDYGTPPAHPVTGAPLRAYRTLNAHNDIPLVRGALEHQGFLAQDIRVLRDADADVSGIRDALQRLVRETDEGDVVVVHYSGHGHRLTNDNPELDDEVDGYDELLVPYGAPDDFYEGYDGSLHIRDDELGLVLQRLRERAGRTGNVTVFLDACYSGTGTRGDFDLPARGSTVPLGPPAGATTRASGDRGTGFDLVAPTTTRGSDTDLAPFAVFSAASQRQVAYETWDVDGKTKVGSLSYALARTLPRAEPGTTYRALFAEITRSLSGKVMQNPQMEGTADAQLFSGRLSQQFAYVSVEAVEASQVIVAAGSLMGLNPGTRLEVHPVGTARADPARALAVLEVRSATATRSEAEVVSGRVGPGDVGAWAFVTDRSYGDLALKVFLDPSLSANDRSGLERVFAETGIMELAQEGADVVVAERNGAPEAWATTDHLVLGRGASEVVRAVEGFARNRYLRRLSFSAPDLSVELDFAPVEIERDASGRPTACAPASWDPASHGPKSLGGSQWSMAPAEAYRLRARNSGARRAFVAVLDLLPGGEIKVLRPRTDEAPSSYEIEVGGTMDLGCYQIADETGQEVLKLFATAAPQDFRAMFETGGTRGLTDDLTGLGRALRSSFTATRSTELAQPEGAATTRSILLRVASQKDPL